MAQLGSANYSVQHYDPAGAQMATKRKTMQWGWWSFLLGGLVLGGCMQSTVEVASDANAARHRNKDYLAAAPYEKATIPEPYKRHIVAYHRAKEAPARP